MNTIKLFVTLLILIHAAGSAMASHVFKDSLTVASDGSGDFLTIQSAIYAADNYSSSRIIIYLKPGVYNEKVKVPVHKTNISIIGSNPEKTIITHSDYSGKKRDVPDKDGNPNFRTFTSYTLRVEGANFTAENITIINSSGEVGQAVALHVDGDKAAFINCRILGHQDTLYISKGGGRSYFTSCYISGTTDFIFGVGIAFFEKCDIVSIRNSYITAAATPEHEPYGFIFKECNLKRPDESVDEVYLGRPWRPFAKTIYIDCYMDRHIKPEGWDNWRNESNEKTATYAELNSKGPGAERISKRVTWSRQLNEDDRQKYDFDRIFKGWRPVFVTGK